MKIRKNSKDKNLSQKITQAIVLIAIFSSVIADVVANVSSELIHTSTMSSGHLSTAGQVANSVSQLPNQQNNIILWLLIIGVNLIFLAIFILLANKLGKRIASGISNPINKMVTFANSIADGDLQVNIDINTMDETGILANALKKIISSLKLLKTDVNTLVEEVEEGKLDTRVDLKRYSGDYREIIRDVNKMLDTVKAPLDIATAFINKLADGEHQEDIKNIYKGYYAALIDDLNNVRHSFATLLSESKKLEAAGLNGDLDVRGDESKLKGYYAVIIHGVNSTFDSIKAPLDVASEFIIQLAAGEVLDTLDNKYKGYFANLIDNLNRVLSSLLILRDESLKLVQAGQNGELDVRGDVSKTKGSWAQIIGGMNGIFEAIAKPLSESEMVLGKMAVNDVTMSISGNYKGKFANLTQSVNRVIVTMQKIEELFLKVSKGDLSLFETYKNMGKLCENDKISPASVSMMQVLSDLIVGVNKMSTRAIDGSLNVRRDESKYEGGFRQIILGCNKTLEAVAAPIDESSRILQELAQGNLTVAMTGEYKGEYNKIKTALNQTIDTFNELLGEINIAASQVAASSMQVSDGSQLLSQGATEQASAVEELTSSITEIAAQTKQNATNAAQASDLSMTVKNEAAQGNEKMSQMLHSMSEINDSSTNILKIIKVIDDIAFQTNILALNAAVEAARAGQYGKGFAVVAEEVRNLAGKSAQAAKETTAMIEDSIRKVETGTKIANETADMLGKIVQSADKSAALVIGIASASNEQATAIAQIDQGVSQVSTVVQTNSATSEENAASSEELYGQANMLTEMVGKFKLRNGSLGVSENDAESLRKAMQ